MAAQEIEFPWQWLCKCNVVKHIPWQIRTMPVMMIKARARSFAAVKNTCTRAASFTLRQFTTVMMAGEKKEYHIWSKSYGNLYSDVWLKGHKYVYLGKHALYPFSGLPNLAKYQQSTLLRCAQVRRIKKVMLNPGTLLLWKSYFLIIARL